MSTRAAQSNMADLMARRTLNAKQARHATLAVLALQAALLLTLWVTPPWNPPRVRLLRLLWAWSHEPQFYPLAALLAGGPLLTWLAWRKRGKHRHYLVVGWAAFLLVVVGLYAARVSAMLQVLWWAATG